MYKIVYEPGYANIFYPESQPKEPLAVTEIGHAHQPAGFDSGDIRRDIFVIQYICSGECTFNGIDVKAPSIIFITPNAPARYNVPSSCNSFSTYWIKFGGAR